MRSLRGRPRLLAMVRPNRKIIWNKLFVVQYDSQNLYFLRSKFLKYFSDLFQIYITYKAFLSQFFLNIVVFLNLFSVLISLFSYNSILIIQGDFSYMSGGTHSKIVKTNPWLKGIFTEQEIHISQVEIVISFETHIHIYTGKPTHRESASFVWRNSCHMIQRES